MIYVEAAEAAINAYTAKTGDGENAVSDLLADLMHYCDAEPEAESFEAALDRAKARRAGEDEGRRLRRGSPGRTADWPQWPRVGSYACERTIPTAIDADPFRVMVGEGRPSMTSFECPRRS